MARKTAQPLKPASWVPDTPKAAETELRAILGAAPESVAALERAWRLAVKVTPTHMRELPKTPETVDDPPIALDKEKKVLARELLGPDVDDAAVAAVAHVIETSGLILSDKRLDEYKRREPAAAAYLTSLLAPYFYACCEVVIGTRDIKSRWWALSELAFNPNAEAPTSGEVWQRIIQSWRKHYMVGGVEGRKDAERGFIKHDDNLTVAWIRRWLEAELKKRRQRNQG
jgi:hypothetical protein